MTDAPIMTAIAAISLAIACVQTYRLVGCERKQRATIGMLHEANAQVASILFDMSECNDKVALLVAERDELQRKLDGYHKTAKNVRICDINELIINGSKRLTY